MYLTGWHFYKTKTSVFPFAHQETASPAPQKRPLSAFQALPAPTAVSVMTTLLTSNIKGELSVCVKVLVAQSCPTLL